jgi:hypothetical protein
LKQRPTLPEHFGSRQPDQRFAAYDAHQALLLAEIAAILLLPLPYFASIPLLNLS